MVIYYYIETIWIIIITPNFRIIYTIVKKIIQINQLICIYNY